MNETKISDLIKSSLNNVKELVDANTVIGDPINTPNGTVILPVSKISIGVASGGLDYSSKKDKELNKAPNFGGGGGTGVSVNPIAFLCISPDGSIELINLQVENNVVDSIVSAVRKTPSFISKVKDSIFSKKGKGESLDDIVITNDKAESILEDLEDVNVEE